MSLIHYWDLDEASGSTAADSAGAWTATVVEDVAGDTVAAGWLGNGRDLGATTPEASISLWDGTPDAAVTLASYSIAVHIKSSGSSLIGSDALSFIIKFGNTYADNTVLNLLIAQNDQVDPDFYLGLEGYTAASASANVYPGPGVFVTTEWESAAGLFIVATCDGSTVTLYVNGAVYHSEAAAPVLYKEAGEAIVGGYWLDAASIEPLSAVVDEVSVWDHALTLSEVEELWNSGAGKRADQLGIAAPVVPEFSPHPLSVQRSYLDIDDGVLPVVRIPISSWQATTQSGQSSFAQAVIPAALSWVDAISDRLTAGEMIITHEVEDIDGSTLQWEVLRAPIQQFFLDRGHLRATARVSSYYTVAAVTPGAAKPLRNVRSLSTSSAGLRVRCEFDPTIKPGDTVDANGTEFTVAYLNAYENSSDRYMDVGERAV